jgi:hypothetical protein
MREALLGLKVPYQLPTAALGEFAIRKFNVRRVKLGVDVRRGGLFANRKHLRMRRQTEQDRCRDR